MKPIYIFTDALVKTKSGEFVIRIIYKIFEFLRYRRSLHDHKQSLNRLKYEFKDLIVRDGFMSGLKYPDFNSYGSAIFPKLSGTYENELNYLFDILKKNTYSTIIDVGCAEGYYAIGLAKHFEATMVYAFDISKKAQQLCRNMALLNNVSDRVKIKEECTPTELAVIVAGRRALIVCDCEGYERYLFNAENICQLCNSDLIIELHPMYEKDVKDYLYLNFANTHNIQYITSYDDNRKVFELPEIYSSFLQEDKIKIIQEGRAFSMDWMIATAKNTK